MAWHGIEWVLPLYALAMVVLPPYGFIVLRKRVKEGMLTKPRAFLYYAGLVLAPIILYAAFFFLLVGLEEVTRLAIVTEGLARTFLLAVGIGVVLWLVCTVVFGVALLLALK